MRYIIICFNFRFIYYIINNNRRQRYFRRLVVIDPDEEWTVQGTVSKCGWTPYEGIRLHGAVKMVWVNGIPVLPGCRPTSGTGLCPGQPLRFQAIG